MLRMFSSSRAECTQSAVKRAFSGAIVDLVTPFRDGELDQDCLRLLIEWQIQCGIDGILVCGEASEASTLTTEERAAIIRIAVDVAGGRLPVLVGTGSNCTHKAVTFSRQAYELGANAVVTIVPYYNKPSPQGVFHHMHDIATAVDLPLIILNRPSVAAIAMSAELAERLLDLPNVIGIIDHTPDLLLASQLMASKSRSSLDSRPCLFGGDDRKIGLLSRVDGSGCFSLAANVAPRLVASIYHAVAQADLRSATLLEARLRPLIDALEADHPVSAVKQALAYVFGTTADVRLPLVPVEAQNIPALRTALSLVGLATDLPFLSAIAVANHGGLRCRL